MTVSFTPSRESLLKRPAPVHCTETGCTDVFESESHLNMHLAKRHGMEHLLKKSELKKKYHCPEQGCGYNKKMHFKQFKLLKQHYVKVHAAKCFVCGLCGKSFSVETAVKHHEEYCGTMFKCSDCSTSYPCYESLQTHCRRKKHKLLAKAAYRAKVGSDLKASKSDSDVCRKVRMLLPKGSDTYIVLVAAKQDKSCQTDTADVTKKLICVETQTIGDGVRLKSHSERISTETQTKHTPPQTTKSCNTSEKLNLTDYAYGDIEVEQKSSSTQTNVKSDDQLCMMDFDATFFNCNTETQTDLFSDALLDSCDFYTNMYTQTPSCGDMLLDDLEFNDTYTQTVLYDDVRSVESQTMLYNNYKKGLLLCRDVANIETQTDLEVQQILEMV